jgi:hypothetical protein
MGDREEDRIQRAECGAQLPRRSKKPETDIGATISARSIRQASIPNKRPGPVSESHLFVR